MQNPPPQEESDYDIFRYLNFNPDQNNEDFPQSILPDSEQLTSLDLGNFNSDFINTILENENNETFMSTQQYTPSGDYTFLQGTGLRNFAETFGRPAFGNRCEAVKEAYTKWNLNDSLYHSTKPCYEELRNQTKISSSPIYQWCEHEIESYSNISKNQIQNESNYHQNYNYVSLQSSIDPSYVFAMSTSDNNDVINTNLSIRTNINTDSTPNNSLYSSCISPDTIPNSILSSLLSSSPTTSTQTISYSSPQCQSKINDFQSCQSYTETQDSTLNPALNEALELINSQEVSKDNASSPKNSNSTQILPNFKPIELSCVDFQPLKFAKCISCTHYLNPEAAAAASVSTLPNLPTMVPLQLAALRPDKPSSIYYIPVPKAMPFTAIQTYFPNQPRAPKRYVTVREMIEARKKQKLSHRGVVYGSKRDSIKRKCQDMQKTTQKTESDKVLDNEKDLSMATAVVRQGFQVKKLIDLSKDGVKTDDQNATTLLCLLPVTENANSKTPLIPPIVLTDFQNGKVNAREYKPKHFEMKSLIIGSYNVEARTYANGRTKNKVKVVFSKRTFIYEFEHISPNAPIKMISIEVSFQSVVAIRCFGKLLQLRVKKQPTMYEGCIKSRHGIVNKTPVYDKKKPVDFTNGQLADHPVHRIILKRSQSNWLRESLIHFDPWFHALFASPIGDEQVQQKLLPSNFEEWQKTCKELKSKKNQNVSTKSEDIQQVEEFIKRTEPEANGPKLVVPKGIEGDIAD